MNLGFSNPYLGAQADTIKNRLNDNLYGNLSKIGSNSIMSGGYGGSRHGIAQGQAIKGTQQAYGDAMSNLYGQAYDADANRGLQRYGMDQQFALGQGGLANQRYATDVGSQTQRYLGDQQYNLGLGGLQNQRYATDVGANTSRYLGDQQFNLGMTNAANQRYGIDTNADVARQGQQLTYNLGLGGLDNQRYGMDQNFYTQQRGQDIASTGLGADLYKAGVTGALGNDAQANYANILNMFSGLGGQATESQEGSKLLSGLGGMMSGAQLAQLLFGSK